MLVVWAVGAAVTYLMLSIDWFMETVGFVAVFTEAMLGSSSNLQTSYVFIYYVFYYRSTSICTKLQKQVHLWHEHTYGPNVDTGRYV